MSNRISPELALTGACCCWPPSEAGNAAVRSFAAEVTNWNRFAGVVTRNRISGLVSEALDRAGVAMPAEVARRLSQGAKSGAFKSFAQARETVRLQQAFDAERVPAVIVKGAPLGVLAFGDVGRKQSYDIDLLTVPEAAVAACRLLSRLGYAITSPAGVNDTQFGRWASCYKEASLRHSETGIEVDLHWRLVENDLLFSNRRLAHETQAVSLASGCVRTLSDEPLFAYLCVHGTLHSWARMKWLADIAALLASRSPQQVEDLYSAARGYGAGRAARVALLLCRQLTGLNLSTALRAELDGDRVARALASNALAVLDHGDGEQEHHRYSLPWLRTLVGLLFVGEGARCMARQLRILWTSQEDRARIALPNGFGFLYHMLRVPLWLCRVVARNARKAAA